MQVLENEKSQTRNWFESLREQLCGSFERIEQEFAGTRDAGSHFERKEWRRAETSGHDGGGGVSCILRGRVFEKAGVHTSTVHGEFSPEFRKHVPGTDKDPRFWASGISVIAHPGNPHVPAAHMNTRFVVTSQWWFGGGSDLTPVLRERRTKDHRDAVDFHAAMEEACSRHSVCDYAKLKQWCEEYFYLPHRGETRGVGGIFFDYHNSGDFAADFAFVKDAGRAFLEIYPELVRRNMHEAWTEAQRDEQLIRRGHYAEFNLLYDRGTQFGLKTGGNVESILSSLPPEVRWP